MSTALALGNTTHYVQSQKCQAECNNHFPLPVITLFLKYSSACLVAFATRKHCGVMFSSLSLCVQSCFFQPFSPWPALLHEVIPPLVGNLAFAPQDIRGSVSPFLQPVSVSLSSDHPLCHDSCFPWVSITCSLARSELSLSSLSLLTVIINYIVPVLVPVGCLW